VSHASYTMVVGTKRPVTRDAYRAAWLGAVAALRPGAPPAPALSWYADVVEFLKLMLGQPSSDEKFLQLAGNVGDLTQLAQPAGTPRYPLIHLLIT
jgi:hypothetical protein